LLRHFAAQCSGHGLGSKTTKKGRDGGKVTGLHKAKQPRPQGLLLVQNGGQRNPWPRLPKWLQKFIRILSGKHNEMSSFRLNNRFRVQKSRQGRQTLETTSEKAISSYVTRQNTPRFLEYFSSLGQGYLRPPF